MIDLQDKARGILLGQACGDALGAQVEFRKRGSFTIPKNFKDGGPHRLKAGMWTDDTAMAVHLGEYMLERKKQYHAGDLMERWISWYDKGVHSPTGECFDIGSRTAAALDHWKREGYQLRGPRPYAEGNGAIMRVSPVAIKYPFYKPWSRDNTKRRNFADWQSRLTHGNIAAKTAVALADALACLMSGGDRVDALTAAQKTMGGAWRNPEALSRPEVNSGGHALDTIEAAFWCLLEAENAEECIIEAVALGDDADTTAAVAGALAGAYWGASALPERWTNTVYYRDGLIHLADELLRKAE